MMPRAPLAALAAAALLATPLAGGAASPGQGETDRGAALYRAGDFERARDAFREAVRLDPAHLQAWENLGWAEQRLGNEREARRIWEHLLRLDPARESARRALASLGRARDAAPEPDVAPQRPRPPPPAEARPRRKAAPRAPPPPGKVARRALARAAMERGDAALRNRELRAAERAYRDGLAAAPDDPRLLARLGRTVALDGRRDEAMGIWAEAARAPDALPAVHGYLALAHHERGERDLARAAYERAIAATPPDDARALLQLADTALALGDAAGAERALATVFALPGLDESWPRRGADLFLRRASAARGVAFFERRVPAKLAGRAPALRRLLVRAGGEAFRAGRLEEAARAFRDAVALDPADRLALRDLGWTYRKMERWDDAERTWRRYATAHPRLAEPHDLLAGLHLDRHEYGKALDAARASLAIAPQRKGAVARMIRSLFGVSRLKEALRLATELARRFPEDPQAQRLYADALTKSRKLPEAARQWERVVALQPDSAAAKQNWLRAIHDAGEAPRAVEAARALADSPDAPAGVIGLLAEDAVARGDDEEAARWFRVLTERFPGDPLHWRQRTDALGRLGRSEEQLAVAREAARRFPDRSEIRLDLTNALGNAGLGAEAIAETRRFVQEFPENRAASRSLVALLVRARRPAEALDELSRSQPSFYADPERRIVEAALRAKLGDDAAAARLLRAVAEPAPGRRYVPILLYHGVVEHEPTLQITARAFDRQMAAIAAQGYQATTLTELARMIDGELPYPPKPILITFDDARSDTFELGDPILERHGLKATVFVPTGRIGPDDGFHAGWGTLERHARSGRWDMQAHGHDAHDRLPIDAEGQRGEFLAYRAWLPEKGRAETFHEFVSRIDDDYRIGKRALEERFPGHEILGYAYPLNQVAQEQPGDQRAGRSLNEEVAARYYRFGLIQDDMGYNALGGEGSPPFMLRRFEVPGEWSGERLLVHLARQEPATAALLELARLTLDGGQPRAARRLVERIAREEPLVAADCERLLAHVAWHERRPRDAADHLAAAEARSGRAPGLEPFEDRLAWRNAPRGSLESSAFADSDGRSTLGFGTTTRQPLPGNVDLELGFWEFRLAERGQPAAAGPQLSAAASATIGREVDVSGWGRYRSLSTVPETLEGGITLGLRLDRHSFALQGAYENVDTVVARRAGIDRRALVAGYAYASRKWRGEARAGRVAFDDGNAWIDLHLSALRLFGDDQRWGFGATIDYDDARFDPQAYWAPERLAVVMGTARYARAWDQGSSIALEAGLGGARDPVRDLRPAALARVRLFHAFGAKRNIAAGIAVSGRAIPGYRSVDGTFRLEMRF